MTIINLYFKLTIIWYLQETFCTNLEESPVIQESIEHIAAHQNPPIDITKKDSSKINIESDCSFGANSSSECDSCHSTSSIDDDDDDSELVEDCSFSKSTIDYLILILGELKLKTTEFTMFFSRSKFLNFIDDSINLIDLFEKVFSSKKNNSLIIHENKMRNVISNFDLIEQILPDVEEVFTMGEVLCDKESELDKIFKDLRSFKEQYDYLKLKFDEYKTSHNQDLNFDFSKEIEALKENKKKLNDEKKNDKIKFKNDLFKDLLDVYENLSQCLKSEHTLITQDFNTLNKFWNDTSICIDYLMCSAESIEKIKGF